MCVEEQHTSIQHILLVIIQFYRSRNSCSVEQHAVWSCFGFSTIFDLITLELA